MKKLFLFLLINSAFCFLNSASAQAPQKFSYQAVVRNASGQLITNAPVGFKISILQDLGAMGMYPAYIETQTATTNLNGLVSLQIGSGTVVSGTFSTIYWTSGNYFIKTQIDPLGGTNYTITDSSQLLSVPYALHAATSGDNYWAPSGVGNIYYNNGGNVGIGTSNPSNKLSIQGNENITGNLGIGTATPAAQLHTTGSVRHESLAGTGVRPIYADANGNLQTVNTVVSSSVSPQQIVPDNACPGLSSIITLGGLPNTISTKNIQVTFTISASYYVNLNTRVDLVAPNGSILNLYNHENTGPLSPFGETMSNLTFADNGPYTLSNINYFGALILSNATIKPSGNMTAICGSTPTVNTFASIGGGTINPNGNWILKVYDVSSGDAVTLNSWTIQINSNSVGVNGFLPKWTGNKLSESSLIFDSGTKVGIGTQIPTEELTVMGNARFSGRLGVKLLTSSPTSDLSVNGTADKPGGGSWAVFSDKRLKQNIAPYRDGLNLLTKISPIKFHYNEKSGCDTKPEYVGVIAQDLQQIAPYMVSTFQKDSIDYLSVDNSAMTYMLINSVKEQQVQIDELKSQIQKLTQLLKRKKYEE